MSTKLIIGLATGVAAGVALTVILKNRQVQEYTDEDVFNPDEELGNASRYLSTAKKKAEDLVSEARERSGVLLDEANEILKNAKEKVKTITEANVPDPDSELKSIKEKIEKRIERLNDKLSDDDDI
ncbi:MAG: hypothetical protein JSS91_10395 [Bacteroidetes bacterium]|nr:hypothetical protein [Bacteroidota bacterium]